MQYRSLDIILVDTQGLDSDFKLMVKMQHNYNVFINAEYYKPDDLLCFQRSDKISYDISTIKKHINVLFNFTKTSDTIMSW